MANPAAAAMMPPQLFAATYEHALSNSFRPIMATTSREYVENVVKEPQNPTPSISFPRGEIVSVFWRWRFQTDGTWAVLVGDLGVLGALVAVVDG
eukprot:CAMPEP_0171325098 /NCGR_PEP_ID=MMETSP0816-20121228/116596_1 /TAXON_ID=420281 /ORGANISM="Proboscia inermis, Strain CCAP1064/1" /LENGTH=94 /DNA_ID=CAMNT_0011824189 /DNA_START=1286 /DNA_END=1570 /DNA_ORIENTATION=-